MHSFARSGTRTGARAGARLGLFLAVAAGLTSAAAAQVRNAAVSFEHEALTDSASLSGDRLLVGHPLGAQTEGLALLYEAAADGSWQEIARLDAPGFLLVGSAVALDREGAERALVSAPFTKGDWSKPGPIAVFERGVDGLFVRTGTLDPPAGFMTFGFDTHSVAISGDVAMAGAKDHPSHLSGIVCVYERQADGSWIKVDELEGPDDPSLGDDFGKSIDLEGDRVVIGAPWSGVGASREGAATVWERDANGSWSKVADLQPQADTTNSVFGHAVALVGDRIVVSAPALDTTVSHAGGAFVFERLADGTWQETQAWEDATPQADEGFGQSVQLTDRFAVVTTNPWYNENGMPAPHASAAFEEIGGSWHAHAAFTPERSPWSELAAADGARLVYLSTVTSGRSVDGWVDLLDVTHLGQPLQTLPEPHSLSAGGARHVRVDAGTAFADRIYLVLGTLSGTDPGLVLPGGLNLPLNPDVWFWLSVTYAGSFPVAGGLGQLDAEGRADATFVLPPGLGGLAGLSVHHAFIAFDAAASVPEFVSNAVAFDFVR